MTTGSRCGETYHLSDAEGRKHAACERGGGGIEQKRKATSQSQAFQKKTEK